MKGRPALTFRGGIVLVLLNHALRGGALGWLARGVLVVALLAVGRVAAWWVDLAPAVQWLILIGALAGFLLVWQRHRVLPRRRHGMNEWLPRQRASDLFWVYDLHEWRDQDDRLVHPDDAARRRDVIRHRVYIGKANDLEARLLQHRADKPWMHDWIVVTAYPHFSEAEAFEDEARRIAAAAQSRWLQDRPRENRALNPTYDPVRCDLMRARAAA